MSFVRNLKKIGKRKVTEEEFKNFWGDLKQERKFMIGADAYISVDEVRFDAEKQEITMFLKGNEIGVFGTRYWKQGEIKKANDKAKEVE